MRAVLFSLLLFTLALSGCSDDAPKQSMEGSHTHGGFYTCPDGTVIDPANYVDHHSSDFDAASKCPGPSEPAAVTLHVASTTLRAYTPVEVTWDVTPASDLEDARATTQVRAGTSVPMQTTPGDGVEVVAEEKGVTVPRQFSVQWTPTQTGDLSLRAYARIGDEDVWSDAVRVKVQPPEPTGTVKAVAIAAGVQGPQPDVTSLALTVGDAVVWQTSDPVLSYEIASGDGPNTFFASTASGAPSDEVLFLRTGTWTYTITDSTPLARTAQGTITVTA